MDHGLLGALEEDHERHLDMRSKDALEPFDIVLVPREPVDQELA